MTEEQASRLEQKLDLIIEHLPTIEALGSVIVRRKTVNERTGISRNTIGQNKKITKFEDTEERKTYIEIKDVSVIRQKKPPRKSR